MKDLKRIIISLIVFIGIGVFLFVLYSLFFKTIYYCTDNVNNIQYTFDTEEEMNAFCDNLGQNKEKDSAISSFSIYNDLINNNDPGYTFYPYADSNNNFVITVVIVDCENPQNAKNKSIEWFKNHSYNINDYKIEYEYPCE